MKYLLKIYLIFIFFSTPLYCQVVDSLAYNNNYNSLYSEKFISILSSAGIQRVGLVDLGIAINEFGRGGYEPFAEAYFLSCEILFGKHPMIGPKIGVWAAGGASITAMGLDLINYTDFKKSSIMLRPQIGLGLENVKIVYGYNIALTQPDNNISRHNVSLTVLINLKKVSAKYQSY